MGCMSASDAAGERRQAPLPRLGEVFFDVRGESRSMRLSWYAGTGVAVFSIWQGSICTGTFRLPLDDLPRMVAALQRGPGGAPGRHQASGPREAPPGNLPDGGCHDVTAAGQEPAPRLAPRPAAPRHAGPPLAGYTAGYGPGLPAGHGGPVPETYSDESPVRPYVARPRDGGDVARPRDGSRNGGRDDGDEFAGSATGRKRRARECLLEEAATDSLSYRPPAPAGERVVPPPRRGRYPGSH
jgi:hypothetical protein